MVAEDKFRQCGINFDAFMMKIEADTTKIEASRTRFGRVQRPLVVHLLILNLIWILIPMVKLTLYLLESDANPADSEYWVDILGAKATRGE